MRTVESLDVKVTQVAINVNTAGANVLWAGQPGFLMIVLQWLVISSVQMNVDFESSGGTVHTGPLPVAQFGGAMSPYSKVGWFRTIPGEDLVIHLGGSNQAGGTISFVMVPATPEFLLP